MKKYYLLFAIFIASLNLRPIITSVAPLLERIQDQLGMSGSIASLLTTLPVICMGVFAPAATALRDRAGLERTIFIALAIITGATALRGLTSSVSLLVASAVIAGIGISVAGPLLSAFIKKYFPTKPGIVSIYSASMTIGAAMASALTIPIYRASGESLSASLSSWAILGVVALLVWSVFLRNNRAGQAGLVRTRFPLRNKRAILLTLFFGCMSSLFYAITAWVSPIAHSFGYSTSSSAMLLTVFTIIQIPATLIVPFLVAKTGNLRFFLILCSLLELVGIMMLLFHLPLLPAVILMGIGAGGLFPMALMLPIIETDTPEEAGSWSAMSQCGGYIIGAAGPLLIGVIYDATGSFLSALISMLVIVAAMIVVQLLITAGKEQRVSAAS